MKRKRLTREESRDQTRERLLEAARAMFMKKGFVATSVEDIAETAGYTRGAFYSNFDSKSELLIELLRRERDDLQASFQSIMEEGGTRQQMEARAVEYYSQLPLEDDFFPLWVEAKLLASRDARFRVRFNAFRNEKLEWVAAYIKSFSERAGTPLPLPPETLALGLVSLCEGMQFFRMTDPQTVTDEVSKTVLAGFFARLLLT
ncbi:MULTISPECIES: TetR/AcrR family transcriptional regulator [Trinickia]|uniref:TetR/AcrR family transcriptional regulator n=1 Tax=Trinickia symbiotica TaxID=863227 RepID=A0A2N7WQT0_9BURK|nr:TetR/AcrR family transcriptional regulator [Trinickia symbiotica]PMS31787.1 TetR/AcrR family transcriptional regulator [Trinickia symbiotica]